MFDEQGGRDAPGAGGEKCYHGWIVGTLLAWRICRHSCTGIFPQWHDGGVVLLPSEAMRIRISDHTHTPTLHVITCVFSSSGRFMDLWISEVVFWQYQQRSVSAVWNLPHWMAVWQSSHCLAVQPPYCLLCGVVWEQLDIWFLETRNAARYSTGQRKRQHITFVFRGWNA